jgi:hypothetical protein
MKTKLIFGLSCILGLGLAACTTSDGGNGDAAYTPPPVTPDGGTTAIDTTPIAPADPYVAVVINDLEQQACKTNGPGSDIDAVALLSPAGAILGWGKSAKYFPNPLGNACENAACSGGNCKYAAIGTTFTEASLVALTTGPADALVNEKTDDSGYFSLNAGQLQVQIGDAVTGATLELKSGNYVMVYEVDRSYVDSGAAYPTCSCLPEHYEVLLQTQSGATTTLAPVQYLPNNTTCSLAATPTEGCGSTEFVIP